MSSACPLYAWTLRQSISLNTHLVLSRDTWINVILELRRKDAGDWYLSGWKMILAFFNKKLWFSFLFVDFFFFAVVVILFHFVLFVWLFFCCYYYLSFNKGCLQRREDLTNIIESRKELTLSTFFISDVAMESNSLP